MVQLVRHARVRGERAGRRLRVYVASRLCGSRQLVNVDRVRLLLARALTSRRRSLLGTMIVSLAHELLVLLRQHTSVLMSLRAQDLRVRFKALRLSAADDRVVVIADYSWVFLSASHLLVRLTAAQLLHHKLIIRSEHGKRLALVIR